MTTLEPRAVGDIPPNVGYHSAITTALNTNIETLTALKNVVETTPMKPVFESALIILTLVRVWLPDPLSFSSPLTDDTTRTG